MAEEKVLEPTKEENDWTYREKIDKTEKKLNEFIMKYQMDIETLNRILSTYEDKIETIEKQYYDISFKLKQLQTNLASSEEST